MPITNEPIEAVQELLVRDLLRKNFTGGLKSFFGKIIMCPTGDV